MDHLLLHCEIASALWSDFFNWVGLPWVMPKRIVALFYLWRGLGGSLQNQSIVEDGFYLPELVDLEWKEG